MKNKLLVILKNIFMYTTLIWSSVMLISYLSIIFELPVFLLISYIPLVGDFIIEVLEFLVLFGIWGIPILYVITIPYILVVKEDNPNKRITLSTIIVPLVLIVLMLATNFLEVLA